MNALLFTLLPYYILGFIFTFSLIFIIVFRGNLLLSLFVAVLWPIALIDAIIEFLWRLGQFVWIKYFLQL